MITLYDYELSGNCYKLRLFMNMLGLDYQKVGIEFFPGKEHKSDDFLALNPLGQLPVLDDDGFVLRDAQAILSYLAARYDTSGHWYPTGNAQSLGEVNMWLAFADGITGTASAARLHDLLRYELDADKARAGAHLLFRVLDEQLWFSERENAGWICRGDHPTIADIACFPYVMLSDEGGISLIDYPALRRWTDRIKRLPGFIVMSGVFETSL
ncbi:MULTISPECIES: glutathione S-transferase family protein [Pseudomonas]|jgi:glutathione S-transferase|uniref:Glutathione S-transferase GstB n=1 Tax=Pseudomonas fluorescens TaxID=294 RepID=A0A5E6VJC9_PSEFL|nr:MULTISPECIES: glutathione S-transferase family protein [Pseudomonas]VVN17733.1 Glutathione S-transferase GstB [Pseudomonas fluorescens]